MTDQAKQQVVIIWQLDASTNMAKALGVVAEKANAYYGKSYSAQRWAEEAMAKGLKAIDNGIKSGTELANLRDYAKERANLPTPPPNDVEASNRYFAAISILDRKYGIGSKQVEV